MLCFLFFGLCSGGGLIQQPLQSKATSLNPFPLREDKGQKQSCMLAPLSDRLSPPPVFRLSRSESSGSELISPPSPTGGTERHQRWKAVAFSLDPRLLLGSVSRRQALGCVRSPDFTPADHSGMISV